MGRIAAIAQRSTVAKKLRSRLKLFLRLYDSQDLHKIMPLQLHDLYQKARVWTEDPDEILREFELLTDSESSLEYKKASDKISLRGGLLDLPYPEYFNIANRTEELLFKMVRALKPLTVVETGIANGRSSAIILAAMDLNNFGNLHSIDKKSNVGALVAEPHNRWSKHIGDGSASFLESVLEGIGCVDLFIHDSDHRYVWQIFEYELAERYGSSSCLIASDDVNWSYAFFDFCQSRSTSPAVLSDLNKCFGIVRRDLLFPVMGSTEKPEKSR